jgi:dipeptidyl aminopeptidase/acylaminoacyl peptidase
VKSFRTLCLAAASAAILAASAPADVLAQAPARAAALPSPADFARLAAISTVRVSPDGRHVAAMTSADGKTPTISVWRTDALDQPPAVLSSARQRIFGFQWAKSDRLYVNTIQEFDAPSSDAGPSYRGHVYKGYIVNLDGSKWQSALPEGRGRTELDDYVNRRTTPEILDFLPNDPHHILVIRNGLTGGGDVYKVNVHTGTSERVARGSDTYGGFQTDLKGEIRARNSLESDSKGAYIAYQIRHPDTGAWEEHFRLYAKEREGTQPLAFTPDPNIIYVSSNKGRDQTGIYTYDIRARKILEPAFEHKLFSAYDPVISNDPKDYGRLLGFTYAGETSKTYWIDETLAAIDKGLSQALQLKTQQVNWVDPASGQTQRFTMADGAVAEIVSWSNDRRRVVISKSGPQQPPEYYLLTDGTKLQLLGRSRPQLEPSLLGRSQLVQYPARDGLMIPGFLHTPSEAVYGRGPYPTIILPHGGPWARDNYEWDLAGWVPFLVSRGHAVLQPQYRGSEGWGQKLWRAGDEQWGLKMQDDKDDGAKWLISQGIADPQRIAMFGYSYGGYAAIAASVRSNGIYQCAISGAGLADLALIRKETFGSRFIRDYQRPTLQGVSWTPRAKEAQVPILIYHGDRDDNVEPRESRVFVNALRSAGKPVKQVELADMGHSYVTMTADHMIRQLEIIDDYLKRDCGPGGL